VEIDIAFVRQPKVFCKNAVVAKEGEKTVKVFCEHLEKSPGKPVVSKLDAKNLSNIL
jgi:hypothetical protein